MPIAQQGWIEAYANGFEHTSEFRRQWGEMEHISTRCGIACASLATILTPIKQQHDPTTINVILFLFC
jgi:hypothetical protein